MISLLMCLTAVAETYDPDAEGDVIASLEILADREAVRGLLLDLHSHPDLWPRSCVEDWEFGAVQSGLGASAEVLWLGPLGWSRRLTMVIASSTEARIDIDQPGDKGFVTTYTFSDGAVGTVVDMHSWINPPPWPLRKAYFKRFQPYFTDCHEQFLSNLAAAAAALPAAQPPAAQPPAAQPLSTEGQTGGADEVVE